MQTKDDIRRRPDGSIDIEHYMGIAAAERLAACQRLGRAMAAVFRRFRSRAAQRQFNCPAGTADTRNR